MSEWIMLLEGLIGSTQLHCFKALLGLRGLGSTMYMHPRGREWGYTGVLLASSSPPPPTGHYLTSAIFVRPHTSPSAVVKGAAGA